jgi:hypothetical protein
MTHKRFLIDPWFKAPPQGRQDRGLNEKKPETQRGLLARRGITLDFPGFSRSRNLFQSSRREVAEPSSGTLRGLLHCLGCRAGIYRRFRQSAPSQPVEKLGSVAGFCPLPRQVAVKSSPEGDPALGWVRPDGRLPVTCFPGAQTELFSPHIIIILGENTRGQEDFLKNIFGPGDRDASLDKWG